MKKEMNLFQLAWPIFVSNILGILLGFIDVFVLSKISDLAASAIGVACQIMSICTLIFSVVCGATSIMVAQYLGKKDREKASQIAAICIAINVILGLAIAIIVFIFHDAFLRLLGAKGELYTMASSYMKIMSWGIALDAYQSIIGSILYSHGKTKVSMYISVSMGILNLILDAILVLGLFGFPRMEVRGAAYATVIVKMICIVIMSVIFFKQVETIHIFSKIKNVKYAELKAIFKLGFLSVFDSVNYSITQLIITGIIFHSLSQTDIVARTYLQNIASFFQLFTNAIASATQIMVGHETGAGDYEKANQDCIKGLRISILSTGTICVVATVFSNQLFGIFTDNNEVIRMGFYLMLVNIIVELGRAVNVIFIWSLRGAGDVSIPVLIAVGCMWIIAVGGSWILVRFTSMGMIGIWMIAGIDECVRGGIMYKRWKSEKWKNKKLV